MCMATYIAIHTRICSYLANVSDSIMFVHICVSITMHNQYLKHTPDNYIEMNLSLYSLNCHTSGVSILRTDHTLPA